MSRVETRQLPLPGASVDDALHAVAVANGWLTTAKRTQSAALVARAEQDLQAAVDGARDMGVQWGQIGVALGIARGNAYQRYRRRVARNVFPVRAPL